MKFDYTWLEPQRMKYGLTIKKDEVEARETSEQVKTSENDRKPSTRKPQIPTASALFAKQNGGKNIPRCVYCKELHYSASCEKGSKSCSTQGNFDERTKKFEVFGSRSDREFVPK